MGDEFRALQRRLKITTLYVTHDQAEAMALSDRVVVMQKGRILQIGDPETVYRRPASREVASFFGTPNLIEAAVTECRKGDDGQHRLAVEGATGRGECRAGQAFERVLSVDPGNMVAHRELGHVLVDGRWMTPEEGYRARGYVYFEGSWITPEERAGLIADRAAEAQARQAEIEAEARIREAEARARAAEAEARRAEGAYGATEGIPLSMTYGSPYAPYGTYGPVVVYGAYGYGGFGSGRSHGRGGHGSGSHPGPSYAPGHAPGGTPPPAPPPPRHDSASSRPPTRSPASPASSRGGVTAGLNVKR